MRRWLPLLVAGLAIAAVLVPYAALGGASYSPAPVADPCATREWRDPGSLTEAIEQVVLSALDGAACTLGVSREELVLGLRSDESLDAFAAEHGLDRADAEAAVQQGLERAIDDAEEAGVLPAFAAALLRRVTENLPARLLLELVERVGGLAG